MSIKHKFQECDFQNGFKTQNSILYTPYKPEVILIGTFNHSFPNNHADFFYGRGMYMWPAMANLFLYNKNYLYQQRTDNNNTPSLPEIFEICQKGKITFADIVKGTKIGISTQLDPQGKGVIVNNTYKWEDYKDSHLDYLGNKGWLDTNTNAIIDFINQTNSIKHIYFTFKSGDWLVKNLNIIKSKTPLNLTKYSIFTPTANGFGRNLPSPFNERLWSLTHCWVWNGKRHSISINKGGYGSFDSNWLISKGVNPNSF